MKTSCLWLVVAMAACGGSRSSPPPVPPGPGSAALKPPTLIDLLPRMESGLQHELSLDLAPGQHISVTQTQLDHDGPGGFSWIGKTENGNVVITVHKGHVLGTIVDRNRTYILSRQGDHIQTEPVVPRFPPRLGSTFEHMDHKPPVKDKDYPIEVIVAYTAAAAKVCDMDVLPEHGVAITNAVAANTGVDASFHLAFKYPTEFVEASQSMDDIVHAFAAKNDGEMDEVHTYRTANHADIAVLLIAPTDTGYTGMSAETTAERDTAFSVVDCTTVQKYFTMSHEIGHLLGLNDDKDRVDSSTFADGYGYAHDDASPEHSWRTVMSGGVTPSGELCKHLCPPIMYWSNPAVDYLDDATGIAGHSDDADVIGQTAGYVSHFEEGHPPPTVTP